MIIPAVALLCYLFMLMAFFGRNKGGMTGAFLRILTVSAVWIGGGLFMRMKLFPGVHFWFDVSTWGVFFLTPAYYDFISEAAGKQRKGISLFLWLFTFFMGLLNAVRGVFIMAPEEMRTAVEPLSYIYRATGLSWVLILVSLSASALLLYLAAGAGERRRTLLPVAAGFCVVVSGGIFNTFSGSGFPADILAGLFNAFFLVYAVYKTQMFKVSERIWNGIFYLAYVVVVMCPVCVIFTGRLRIGFLLFGLWVIVWNICFNHGRKLVFRYLDRKMERLRVEFQQRVSGSLRLSTVYELLVSTIERGLLVDGVFIMLKKDGEGRFVTGMEHGTLQGAGDRFCELFSSVWREGLGAGRLTGYVDKLFQEEGVDEESTGWLREKHMLTATAMIVEQRIIGVVMTADAGKRKLSDAQITFLDEICSFAAIAVKNAQLYERLYWESRTDELTKLYNRKYFYEKFRQMANEGGDIALLLLDIDDLRLYNELYGSVNGDALICLVADCVKKMVGDEGCVARYSRDEFAILFQHVDADRAIEVADEVNDALAEESFRGNMRIYEVTLSGGVSTYPALASDVDKLVEQAEKALFRSKKLGKKQTTVYAAEMDSKSVDRIHEQYDKIAPTVYALTAAIDSKDNYTFVHSTKVSEYAVELARGAGLEEDDVEIVREAGLLHDIGKIGVPEKVLMKPSKLTDEEYGIMKKHVENSIDIIRYLPNMNYVVPAVVGHHERYDGKGYPRGIAGEDIPLLARCLAVADSFEAMTAKRVYKESMSVEAALQELIRNKGTQFDAGLVDIFVRLVREGKIKV